MDPSTFIFGVLFLVFFIFVSRVCDFLAVS